MGHAARRNACPGSSHDSGAFLMRQPVVPAPMEGGSLSQVALVRNRYHHEGRSRLSGRKVFCLSASNRLPSHTGRLNETLATRPSPRIAPDVGRKGVAPA